MIKLTKRNQSYLVETDNPRVIEAIRELELMYTTYELVYDHRLQRNKKVLKYKYMAYNPFQNVYMININIISYFVGLMRNKGIKPEDITFIDGITKYPKVKLEYITLDLPRDYQKKYEKALIKNDKQHAKLVDLQMGKGKAVTLNTKIKVPSVNNPNISSWVPIGSLKVGDVVQGADGLPTAVTGYYPQGVIKIYKMTFEDGTTSLSCAEHQWKVYHNKVETIMTTASIMKHLENNDDISIPVVKPEKREDVNVPIDPYIFGILLSLDKDILTLQAKNDLYDLGWRDYNSRTIPEIYKNSSYEQKLELLQGALYNNITILDNHIVLTLEDKNTLNDIVEVLRSIGAIVKVNEITKTLYNAVIKYQYPKRLLSNGKHRSLLSTNLGNLKRKIKSVKYVYKDEAVCISVANKDKLYVIKNYIVTHNTFIAAKVISTIHERTLLLLLPMYVKKWIIDLKKHFQLDDDEIVTINGKNEMVELMTNKKKAKKAKFILISNRTMLNYINEYETSVTPDLFGYPVEPQYLTQHIKAGVVLVDEVHRELYSVYKAMLYLDPKLLIGLSATFVSKDKTVRRVQETLFNDDSRLSLVKYDPYAIVKSTSYLINQNRKFEKMSTTRMGYSHIAFEKVLLANRMALRGYFKMIDFYVKKYYVDIKKDDQKCIIFCSSKHMCKVLSDHLQSVFKDLDVKRYVAEDPQTNLYDSDIRVTTIKSGGEAVDIPGLIYGLLTVAIGADIANLQALGRLREIKGQDVIYQYIWSMNMKAHRNYDKSKRNLFYGKVKRIDTEPYGKAIDQY